MLVELANSYIAALNQGQVPNIENAWSNVCSFEQERTYKESLKYFDQEINSKIKDLDVGFDNVKTLLKEIRAQALKFLKDNFLGDSRALLNVETKLKTHLKSRTQQVIKEVQSSLDQQINDCIKQEFLSKIDQRVRRDEITSID